MRVRRFIWLVFALLLAPSAGAQPTSTPGALAARIDEVLNAASFSDARWGVFIADVATDEVLYARSEALLMMPASNMKLVTTAAALDELGPDYRFPTRLYLDGDLRYGTLSGSLVVRGSGDPRFGGRYSGADLPLAFQGWADSLRQMGVRNVLGPLVVADDVVDEPETYFLRAFREALREAGIGLASSEVEIYEDGRMPDYGRMRRAATHLSPPLSAFVRWTNTESDNLYAERILRSLAGHVFPGGGPVHPALRARAADRFLDRVGIDPYTCVVADGSGLSRDNRLTPIGIVGLLRAMWDHPDDATADAFVASLPLGGFTGTLERRYRAGDARGNVRAKTGFIRGVRTLSGYVTTATGRTLVFSLMCNEYTVSTNRVNRAQDDVVELLADYLGQPSPTQPRRTRPDRRASASR